MTFDVVGIGVLNYHAIPLTTSVHTYAHTHTHIYTYTRRYIYTDVQEYFVEKFSYYLPAYLVLF